jgi:hypothetical protein
MVHANYEDFNFDYSENIRRTVRPRSAEPGGMFATDQDEAHLEHSAMAIREELMVRQTYLRGFRYMEFLSAEEKLRYSFLEDTVGYMGLVPGSLSSVWRPTTAKEWAIIARNFRLHELHAQEEFERSRSADGAEESGYPEAVAEVSTIFRLLAEHFEAAVEKAKPESESV